MKSTEASGQRFFAELGFFRGFIFLGPFLPPFLPPFFVAIILNPPSQKVLTL
jgi:hypothetical protein